MNMCAHFICNAHGYIASASLLFDFIKKVISMDKQSL